MNNRKFLNIQRLRDFESLVDIVKYAEWIQNKINSQQFSIQLPSNAYKCFQFYGVNLWVFPIAYHRLNIQLRS